jgi:hypothetical protein
MRFPIFTLQFAFCNLQSIPLEPTRLQIAKCKVKIGGFGFPAFSLFPEPCTPRPEPFRPKHQEAAIGPPLGDAFGWFPDFHITA